MFLISHEGQELEPMDQTSIEAMIAEGSLTRNDWVWDENTESWVPISEIFPESFPTFGAALPDDMNEADLPTEAIPPSDRLIPDRFTKEGQRFKIVKVVVEMLDELLEPGERLLQLATQRKPMPDFSPEALALTNQRIFVFEKGHFKTVYEEFTLSNILHPVHKKGIFFGDIAFNAGAGEQYGVKFIPKQQSIKFFDLMDAEIHRVREEKRAALSAGAGSSSTAAASVQPVQTVKTSTPSPVQSNMKRSLSADEKEAKHNQLEELKQMADQGLISQNDFKIKKKAILKEL
jgi:hypothetical protein